MLLEGMDVIGWAFRLRQFAVGPLAVRRDPNKGKLVFRLGPA